MQALFVCANKGNANLSDEQDEAHGVRDTAICPRKH